MPTAAAPLIMEAMVPASIKDRHWLGTVNRELPGIEVDPSHQGEGQRGAQDTSRCNEDRSSGVCRFPINEWLHQEGRGGEVERCAPAEQPCCDHTNAMRQKAQARIGREAAYRHLLHGVSQERRCRKGRRIAYP
jgi:hypothetical protein